MKYIYEGESKMLNLIKKGMYLGIGLFSLTKEKAERFVDELMEAEKIRARFKKGTMFQRDRIMNECVGDCLLVIGMPGHIKVHFHTDQPEDLFKILEEYGTFEMKAIEDMKEQYEAFRAKKKQEKEENN